MTTADHNPYQAPKADLNLAATAPEGTYIPGGQSVPAGNAMRWVGQGWTLFTKSPGIWIVNVLLMFLITMVMAAIPFLGGIASTLLMPVFMAGIFLGCKALDDDEPLEVSHLFAGFNTRTGQLVVVGALMFAFTIVLVMVIVALVLATFGVGLLQAAGNEQALTQMFMGGGLLMLLLIFLVAMALSLPITMAFWFAPALVVFHGLEATQAMKQSFRACLRNILPFLVYGVLMLVLLIVAVIPLGLGLLVFGPLAYGAWYASYKDIFLER